MRCPACGRENEWSRAFCEGCAEELFRGAGAHLEPPRAKDRGKRRRQAVAATASNTVDSVRNISSDLIEQARPDQQEIKRLVCRGLLVLSAVIPGLGHYFLKEYRLGKRLFIGFLASLLTWQIFIGIFVGTLAELTTLAIIGTSILDVLRHDPLREKRTRILPSQILLSLAFVLLLIAAMPFVMNRFWERAILTQPILQLAPPSSDVRQHVLFHRGDRILFSRNAYEDRKPARGDIVLADVENIVAVQRVLAVPGDEIVLNKGYLYINGKVLPAESYPLQPETPLRNNGGTVIRDGGWYRQLRDGEYAVWGVNLPNYYQEGATASITPVTISESAIHGKGWLVYSPFYHRHFIKHYNANDALSN